MAIVLGRLISWRALSAWAFTAGLLTGVAALSLLGRFVASQNYIEDFHRFHRYINYESLFYPTASQVRALALASGPPDQIFVIAGGSSVLFGSGQGVDELWSNHLQRALGDRFTVLNFAFPGGAPQEHGAVAAQSLAQEGFKVIYVMDVPVNGVGAPPDGSLNKYVFWDAYYKGRLPEHPERMARIEVLTQRFVARKLIPESALTELRIRAFLDSWLYFTDLWNTVGYTTLFTTWSQFVEPIAPFTTPRKYLKDPLEKYTPDPVEIRYRKGDPERDLTIVRSIVPMACRRADDAWVDIDLARVRSELEVDARATFPESFRRQTIVSVTRMSPFYIDKLSDEERRCLGRAYDFTTMIFERVGYRALVTADGFLVEDYDDRVHLTGSGGEKLALQLAPAVREMAQRLGYME